MLKARRHRELKCNRREQQVAKWRTAQIRIDQLYRWQLRVTRVDDRLFTLGKDVERYLF